ncbi:MAG: AmmeMemoRadiSam system protein B [Syntrophaceae bacterium]|jgi:MEMO1 family protein|nr:AmmeMemoRadiSam system protein B [Syntrophaceae bacterium]
MEKVRKSVMAGSWYSGNPSVLRSEIAAFIRNVPDRDFEGDVVGMLVPHAGYVYSGQVAAHAYKLIQHQKYDDVILLGPSHKMAFRGVSIYEEGVFETPLGRVLVSEDLAKEIKKQSSMIVNMPAAHTQEHALEIQLPFLQEALGNFLLIPLVMGEQSAQTCRELAAAIVRGAGNRRILIVASSDLSHFYNDRIALQLDGRILRHLQENDPDGLMDSLACGNAEACGGGPMAVMMLVADMLGAGHPLILKYADSGDVTGDKTSVVGYASAVFYRENNRG